MKRLILAAMGLVAVAVASASPAHATEVCVGSDDPRNPGQMIGYCVTVREPGPGDRDLTNIAIVVPPIPPAP